jgi:monoamine oxidase
MTAGGRNYDVAIIGAGAAGLAAAQELCWSGLRVAMVEARSRIGGRIYTLHPTELLYPIELGAEFIQGTPPATWEALSHSGLTAYEVTDQHWHFDETRKGTRLHKVEDFWEKLDRRLKFTNFHTEHESLYRISQGHDRLLHQIWNKTASVACSVLLNYPVKEIRWNAGEVELTQEDLKEGREDRKHESIFAEQVIVTIPVGVLGLPPGISGHVKFSPELRDKDSAIGQLAVSPVTKIILHLNQVLWEELGLKNFNFIHTSPENSAFPTWWNPAPVQVPILTGWASGSAADTLSHRTEEEILELAYHSLARIFSVPKATIMRGIEHSYSYDWQADPFSRGAYSFSKVGGQSASQFLSEPVADTLFFAGEATQVGLAAGTVDGAIRTGRRAAKQVLNARRNFLKKAA